MELFVNDLSLHRQFQTTQTFCEAFGRLMAMRAVAWRYGRGLHCHRMLASAEPVQGMTMQQALGGLRKDERRAAMSWMTRGGPFWDDSDRRRHSPNDYMECSGEIVTDSGVGEAAYRTLRNVECGLVSVDPSDWLYSPVEVVWRREAEGQCDEIASLGNWWRADTLENGLHAAAVPVRSWNDLRNVSTNRFDRLTFAGDCFKPLVGIPFALSAAERFRVLLDILNRFARAVDAGDPAAQRILREHLTGENTWFSDSSDSEKRDFRHAMTFAHPGDPARCLFCPWHGKVRHMTLRLHFSWPIRSGEPVYVVYAGPKITKR